jgi:hypothetical protein
MLRRVLALYNNSKVLSTRSSSSFYQFNPQHVLYLLYGMLVVQFLGSELTAVLTYFYLHYIDGGKLFGLLPVARGPNPFCSCESTGARGAILRMPTDRPSPLLLDVCLSPRATGRNNTTNLFLVTVASGEVVTNPRKMA